MRNSQEGFTIVEVIIVIGIMAVLSTGVTILFLSTQSNNEREVIVNEIISSLRKSQTRSMSGEDSSEFGVYFESNRYIEFKGAEYVEGAAQNVVNLLPAGIRLQSIDFDGGDFVYYERMSGEPNSYGSVDVVVTGISGRKRILVNSLGTVTIENVE